MLITELHIKTNDLAGTRGFYIDRLALPVKSDNDQILCIQIGSCLLYFHATTEHAAQYHIAFNIPCNQILNSNEWLKGKINPIVLENGSSIVDFRNWNAESIYFLDNNNNVLEFIARRDLKNSTELPFDSKHLLSISEVGIVTDHVQHTCDAFIRDFGLHYFDKQPPLENFAALGDDQGLLIISSAGRNWFPTGIVSKACWLELHMNIHNKNYVLSWNI